MTIVVKVKSITNKAICTRDGSKEQSAGNPRETSGRGGLKPEGWYSRVIRGGFFSIKYLCLKATLALFIVATMAICDQKVLSTVETLICRYASF